MLKLTYTENGFYLECLAQSLEDWVAQRVLVSLRAGVNLAIEPSTASFLLSATLSGLDHLLREASREYSEIIDLCQSDPEYWEVSLNGTWMTSQTEKEEGIFITQLSPRLEFFLYKLWQESQACTSPLS